MLPDFTQVYDYICLAIFQVWPEPNPGGMANPVIDGHISPVDGGLDQLLTMSGPSPAPTKQLKPGTSDVALWTAQYSVV